MNKIKIIYEDENLLVINKPAGLVCNRSESVKEVTLQDWNLHHSCLQKGLQPLLADESAAGQVEKEFRSRSGLVHRLDKETSGVMVLAKDVETFVFLQKQFKERKTKKKYLALVHGKMSLKKGTINLPLKRNILNRHKFCVDVDGKMARTEYEVIKEYRKQETRNSKLETRKSEIYSLIEVNLLTGRTHQIRVHLTHLGYPLVSDPLYLGKRLQNDLEWCPRMFLHAKYLSFIHPKSLERVEFEGELPKELEESLSSLSSFFL